MTSTYHFSYTSDGVYAHVVALVSEFAGSSGVLLDLGCGYGAIAEPIRDLGLTYVGADSDPDGLADLRGRGFEAHPIDLANADQLAARAREILGDRQLAAITMIDVLEHITNDVEVLKALRSLTDGRAVPLVVAVPNVGHRDLGFKLLTGRWQYTETGLLDHTHVIHHTQALLEAMATSTGWRSTRAHDYELENSDQHFPEGSVVLSPNTTLNQFLRRIRNGGDQNASINELVRAFLPAQEKAIAVLAERETQQRPFLTVIMRTQGRRPAALRDALLCLAGQSCMDFEVLLIAHRVDVQHQITVERIVEELPRELRDRVRLHRVDHGNRATPLNVATGLARGLYVSILDDDDLVFAHWVETFKDLSGSGLGRVLRAVAVEQDIEERVWEDGSPGYLTVSGFRRPYPAEYDLFAHLTQNFSPLMSLSFPSALFHELGFRFDEELDTCEDWDLELRSVLTCGIATSPEITAIYRRWKVGHASNTVHAQEVWQDNYQRIVSRLNEQPHVFPPGTVKRIREMSARLRHLERENAQLKGIEEVPAVVPQAGAADFPLRYRIADKLNRAVKRTPVHGVLKRILHRRKD
jgi:SAM-dependent methyltransferase